MIELLEECTTILELIEFYDENNEEASEDFDDDIVMQAANIIGLNDKDFASTNEYRDLMADAFNRTEEILIEIDEAINALDVAEDMEEMDMMTENVFIDMESDEAMNDAQIEIQDVNNILGDYKNFLIAIGESATGLYGSDFDFGWDDMMNEAFFGDFWGGSMNLDKIEQARDHMIVLQTKVDSLLDRFDNNYNETVVQIQERVDLEWDKATEEDL